MAIDNDISSMLHGDEGSIGESESGSEQLDSDAEQGDPLEDRPELQQQLISLYAKCKAEDRYSRLVEVKDVKQEEFYWTGRQYIWWSNSDQRWNLPTQQAANYGDLNIDDMPRFEF